MCGYLAIPLGRNGEGKQFICGGLDASLLPLKCICNVKIMSVTAGDLDENAGGDHGVE